MGEEGASITAPDFQTMLKKVQETNYHTSIDEQMEVENMGWDINFPPGDIFSFPDQIDAEADPVQELLTRRAANGELSEAEATRQLRTFHADRIERRLRQLMALFDVWKRRHFPNFSRKSIPFECDN